MSQIAVLAARIRAVECSRKDLNRVTEFFCRFGITASVNEPKDQGGGFDRQVIVRLNPEFRPWKLRPDELEQWKALPVRTVEKFY